MINKIPAAEFAARRQRLLMQLPEGSAVLLPGAQMQPRNRDVDYPFRQDSDFYYLTGFDEPDAVLLLIRGEDSNQYLMFCQDRDPEMEIWHGYRTGPEGLVERYGVDRAWPVEQIDEILPTLIDGQQRLYFSIGDDEAFDGRMLDWLNTLKGRARQGAKAPTEMHQLNEILHEMRLFKSPHEQQIMRRAGELSAQAHIRAMQACRPGLYEYQLEAEIMHSFASEGCRQPAYPSIVGGGENACVLHYTENRDLLVDGDLVLIDAGIELDYFAGDITRTFPVGGVFGAEQRALYQLVLDAQQACIEATVPGARFNDIHELSVKILTRGLVELGLLNGDVEHLIAEGAYREFYMHRVSHWLGMDVHDVGEYQKDGLSRPLEPGMVLTIEPGLYVSPFNENVEARWRGIGIRIEDDVLVTAEGAEVLTASVPKQIADIEALMAAAQSR
ncbi:Xaa-Pro aminopeptidase [Marinobacterium jannaschii]|uniref:Xaa-Pro aminopeptidase n=1 Tax=Marinobacterium jannaschii TaxID=64970 RepID=UPI00055B3779|nr:Xaa-Pro aminopeptidase [Marinobacterium jannaschii]